MSRRIDPESPSVWRECFSTVFEVVKLTCRPIYSQHLVPPPKSRFEKLKIRHELLVPNVLPEKALARTRLSTPDILYQIDRPACSLYVQETVSPASRSSHTLVGDTSNDMLGNFTMISPGA